MQQPKLVSSYESPAEARLEMPDGLTIVVTRVPLESGASQLAVFINTEKLVQDHFDPEDGRSGAGAGVPEMEIILNDVVLYDCEPDTGGVDKAKQERATFVWTVLHGFENDGGPECDVFYDDEIAKQHAASYSDAIVREEVILREAL